VYRVTHHTARAGMVAAAAVLIAASASASGRGIGRSGSSGTPYAGNRIIYGERQTFGGLQAYTWVRTNVLGKVQEIGVRIPAELIMNPTNGPGPLGAFLSLDYPDIVKDSTFLDHFEAHWNPQGHEPDVFAAPHFDFHFYGIPESEVWGIVPPDTRVPNPNRLPAGYFYPGVDAAVPMMGVHAIDPRDLDREFSASMVMGYWGGDLTFIEPMVTQEFMLRRPNFAMAVPRPQYLDRQTEYPAVFRSRYDPRARAYELTLSGFSSINAAPEDF